MRIEQENGTSCIHLDENEYALYVVLKLALDSMFAGYVARYEPDTGGYVIKYLQLSQSLIETLKQLQQHAHTLEMALCKLGTALHEHAERNE